MTSSVGKLIKYRFYDWISLEIAIARERMEGGELTCARFDCFVGSLSVGRCALNWRLRVTDRANFANFERPRTLIWESTFKF